MIHKRLRRHFLKQSAVYGAGLWLLGGRGLLGSQANEDVRVAIIGVGGRGEAHLDEAPKAGGKIVALCDVDERALDKAGAKFTSARRFRDFREMLDRASKDIDAVVVSTPDHTHAVAASAAMKLGKHVYCEKPLAHSLHETRYLTELASKMGVATQMGNQGHSGVNTRRIVELVRSGAIGGVREAHAWTNRPIWPQGIDRPAEKDVAPDWLAWDLWLGPALNDLSLPTGTQSLLIKISESGRAKSEFTILSLGAAGGTLGRGHWATWPATSWTLSSGHWSWELRFASRPRGNRESPKAGPLRRPFALNSPVAETCRQ